MRGECYTYNKINYALLVSHVTFLLHVLLFTEKDWKGQISYTIWSPSIQVPSNSSDAFGEEHYIPDVPCMYGIFTYIYHKHP